MDVRLKRRLRGFVILVACALAPLAASPRARAAEPAVAVAIPLQSLAARTRAFLEPIGDGDARRVREFFPATGTFSYLHTQHGGGGSRTGIWQFPAHDVPRLLEFGGELWESVNVGPENETIGLLGYQVKCRGAAWRHAYGTRFVPPGAPASSPTFVEWRREGGQWVISSLGDESFATEPLPEWVC